MVKEGEEELLPEKQGRSSLDIVKFLGERGAPETKVQNLYTPELKMHGDENIPGNFLALRITSGCGQSLE